jgi:hypothetical protein
MDSTITLIIVFAIGWFLGSRIQWFLDQITFKEILNDLGVTTKQLTNLIERADAPAVNQNAQDGDGLTPVEVTLEQHQGVIFAYRKDTQQFLGQGVDQAELITSIKNRMQGVRLVIDHKDGAELLQKNNG